MGRNVVITGLGTVTGLGLGIEPLWEGLLAGRSALGPIGRFDASGFPAHFAGEVDPSFAIRDWVPKTYRKGTKVMCRDIELAVAAAALAVRDAGLTTKGTTENGAEPTYRPQRSGCQIGAGLIVAELDELTTALSTSVGPDGRFDYRAWGESGMKELTPLWLLKYLPNMLACHVTIIHDCRGPSNTLTCSEASGALSVGESRRVIERNDADVCFSGGAESKLNPLEFYRQCLTGMIAQTSADEDATAIVRPFAAEARGSLPGEGAAIMIVEAEETATARGARAYARIAGFGAAQSAYLKPGSYEPDPSGAAISVAVRAALRDAGLGPEAIDAIVPMGCGSPQWDASEAAGLASVFGEQLAEIPLVLTKPGIGLCGASASALDLAVGALLLRHQALPARPGGWKVLPGVCAGPARQQDAALRHVLTVTSSFGGQCCATVLSRVGKGGA